MMMVGQTKARFWAAKPPKTTLFVCKIRRLPCTHRNDFPAIGRVGDDGEAAIHGQRPADQADPAAPLMQRRIPQYRPATEQEEGDPEGEEDGEQQPGEAEGRNPQPKSE